MSPGKVKVNGTWRDVAEASVKVNGTWRNVAEAYTKVNSAWKQWFKSAFPAIAFIGRDMYGGQDADDQIAEAWAWSTSGFGAKFANSPSLIDKFFKHIDFSSSGKEVLFYGSGEFTGTYVGPSPRYTSPVNAYQWNPGFGTKYADPSVYVETNQNFVGAGFNPENSVVGFGNSSSLSTDDIFSFYQWNPGFGTRYSLPSFLERGGSTSGGRSVRFSPNTNHVALGFSDRGDNDHTAVYTFSEASGLGTKLPKVYYNYSRPGFVFLEFSSSGNTIFVNEDDGTGVGKLRAYNWDNGFGTKYSSPADENSYGQHAFAVHPFEDFVAYGTDLSSNPFAIRRFTEGVGWGSVVEYPNFSGNSNSFESVDFSKDGLAISFSSYYAGNYYNAPVGYWQTYSWSSSGFLGSQYSNPTNITTSLSISVPSDITFTE